MNIDFGLSVTYDGKSYTLLSPKNVKEYPIGGLICEYCRLSPTKIKDIVLSCPDLDAPVTPDTTSATVMELHKKLFEFFPPVTATMISLEFQNAASDWMKAIREDCVDKFTADHFTVDAQDNIAKFILADSGFESFGIQNILQMMLSCYYTFATVYVNIKYMFSHIICEKGESEQRNKVLSFYDDLYGKMIDMQHIDFRILATVEKGLESLYTIKSSLSLLLFEMAHCQQADQKFVKCPNCNQVFVPEGRSDAIYCNYPSPQNPEKTCREIGAQVARANKEKNDIVTKEYRRAYMRYQMMTKRHPHDKEKRQQFDALTTGMKEWRTQLADGSATADDFLAWLEQFK